jgi:tetratricopeptide (TPR) repeat protein
MITTAWMGLAANLESLGKNDEALSTYQRLASQYPQSYSAPLALLAQIPLLKAKNKTEEARRICETLISQYRDSAVTSEAFRELMTLPRPSTEPETNPAATPALIPMQRPPETPAPTAKP